MHDLDFFTRISFTFRQTGKSAATSTLASPQRAVTVTPALPERQGELFPFGIIDNLNSGHTYCTLNLERPGNNALPYQEEKRQYLDLSTSRAAGCSNDNADVDKGDNSSTGEQQYLELDVEQSAYDTPCRHDDAYEVSGHQYTELSKSDQ